MKCFVNFRLSLLFFFCYYIYFDNYNLYLEITVNTIIINIIFIIVPTISIYSLSGTLFSILFRIVQNKMFLLLDLFDI